MNEQQINVAIAEACGWAVFASTRPSDLLNYCNCLNAMHEAEKTLTQDQSEIFYPRWLGGFMSRTGPIYATARQRAEAFLRTIGKWEGD